MNVNKTRKHLSRNFHGMPMFPQCFPVSHAGNITSSVCSCFQDTNYAYVTRQGILTEMRACEQLQKFCEHEQESTYLIFASNPSKSQALSNWMGPFDTPLNHLTRQTSEKVAFKSGFDNLFRVFSAEYFFLNHQRFARKISKISVTGGAAAPLAPPARTPMPVL